MEIRDVYKKFEIPPNLREHMLMVSKIVCILEKYWIGDDIDWVFIKQSALLHDIGNIVKFDFDKHPEFLGEEAKNIEYWGGVKKRIVKQYGADDHMASGNMLKEIGMTEKLCDVIQNKSFSNVVAVSEGDDWYPKILLYADMRVMPFGIVTLEERLTDVRNRMPQYTTRPDFEDLLDAARNIEKQVAENLDISIFEIQWDDLTETDEELLAISV